MLSVSLLVSRKISYRMHCNDRCRLHGSIQLGWPVSIYLQILMLWQSKMYISTLHTKEEGKAFISILNFLIFLVPTDSALLFSCVQFLWKVSHPFIGRLLSLCIEDDNDMPQCEGNYETEARLCVN